MKPERERINAAVAQLRKSERGCAAIKQLRRLLKTEYTPVGLDGRNVQAYCALISYACLDWYDSVQTALRTGKCDDPEPVFASGPIVIPEDRSDD